MSLLLAKLPNPVLVQILNYIIGREDKNSLKFCPQHLNALVDMFCVCKAWCDRFGHQDSNLWQIIAIDLDIDVEIRSANNHRRNLFLSYAKKQLTRLVEALNAIKFDPISIMWSLLESGEINQLVYSLRACVANVPLRERQVVAEATIAMVCRISMRYDEEVNLRFVEVPGLLTSLASLCGEDTFLRSSGKFREVCGEVCVESLHCCS